MRQDPDEVNVPSGHVLTHFPLEATWLAPHVKQKPAEPVHEEHDESQARKSHCLVPIPCEMQSKHTGTCRIIRWIHESPGWTAIDTRAIGKERTR